MTWNKSLIDNTWEVGSGPSFQYMDIDPVTNYPYGIVKDSGSNQMLFVQYDGVAWQEEEARPSVFGGWAGAAVAKDSGGNPAISFMAFGELKLRYKSGGSWTEVLLYNANTVSSSGTSIVINSSDLVTVGFVDQGGISGFRAIQGAIPNVTTLVHLDQLGTANVKGSIGPNDQPWFVYERSGNPARYTRFDGVVWSDGEIKSSIPQASTKPSVAIGPTNEAHMAYRDSNSDTGYTHYDGAFSHEVITTNQEPANTSIYADKDNEPRVAIDSNTDGHLYYYDKIGGPPWIETDVDNTHENLPNILIDEGLGRRIFTDGSVYEYTFEGFPILNQYSVSAIDSSSITTELEIHETGDVFMVAVPAGDSAPNSTDVENGTGQGGSPASSNDSIINLGLLTIGFIDLSGLSPNTIYDLYIATRSVTGVLQDTPASILGVMTNAAPVLNSIIVPTPLENGNLINLGMRGRNSRIEMSLVSTRGKLYFPVVQSDVITNHSEAAIRRLAEQFQP